MDWNLTINTESYTDLGGQQQYIRMRGRSTENPVVIYLHGGPGYPTNYLSYQWQEPLWDFFTFVDWDQRGCGRTYYRNRKQDPNNKSLTYDQAQNDLDELVHYVQKALGAEKVILLGHSYGTMPAISYAGTHPDNVLACIGASVVVDMPESEEYSYRDARGIAEAKGDSTEELDKAFEKFAAWDGKFEPQALMDMNNLRKVVFPYHPSPKGQNSNMMKDMLHSPDHNWTDIRWLLKPFSGYNAYLQMNWPLYEHLLGTDLREERTDFQTPVYMVSGTADWITPTKFVRDYYDRITAPDKELYLMPDCGHNCLTDDTVLFKEIMEKIRSRIQQ